MICSQPDTPLPTPKAEGRIATNIIKDMKVAKRGRPDLQSLAASQAIRRRNEMRRMKAPHAPSSERPCMLIDMRQLRQNEEEKTKVEIGNVGLADAHTPLLVCLKASESLMI